MTRQIKYGGGEMNKLDYDDIGQGMDCEEISPDQTFYLTDEVANFAKRGLIYRCNHSNKCGHFKNKPCDCGYFEYLAELEEIAKK